MKILTKAAIAAVAVLSIPAAYFGRDTFASYPAVPTHAMPNPNGFDYVEKAGEGIVSDLTKAGTDGDAAIGLHADKLTLQQKEAVLKAVAPDLMLLHQGIGLPFESPPVRSWTQNTPYISKYRRLARLLGLESSVQEAHRDWKGAASTDLDGIQLAIDIPKGSTEIGQILGTTAESIGRTGLWRVAPHLTVSETLAAQSRLEHIESQRQPLANCYLEEKYCGQASLLSYYSRADWSGALVNDLFKSMGVMTSNSTPKTLMQLQLASIGKKRLFDQFTAYENSVIHEMSLPYTQLDLALLEKMDPINTFIYMSMNADDVYLRAHCRYSDDQAQNGMLITALALKVYHDDNGSYPSSLATLVPKYLIKIPNDPFATSGSIKYLRTGSNYTLYSVGPDGADDHGKPISKTATETLPAVLPDSKGDIVAGVNP